MNLTHKNVGIWGLGVSGHALLNYLLTCQCTIHVLDRNQPDYQQQNFFAQHAIKFYHDENQRNEFLEQTDIIIPSPGIDVRPYHTHSKKFLSELDLFQSVWRKAIIAITGTLGKTSITHLLGTLFNKTTKQTITGGNIGVGMFDLVNNQAEQALLELSSFQLEHTQTFAPDLAIWTNLFPNHLDRHGTMNNYFEAKKNILLHQKLHQKSLVPLELAAQLRSDAQLKNRSFAFFVPHQPSVNERELLQPRDTLYFCDDQGNIKFAHALRYNPSSLKLRRITQDERYSQLSKVSEHAKETNTAHPECFRSIPMRRKCIEGYERQILSHHHIPNISYKTNWLIIAATLDLMGHDAKQLITAVDQFTIPHYRLERVATINDVTYYNDSKSTIMQSTIAAVKEIQNGPIILLLGGLSKGVDRSPYIEQLQNKVTKIVCFGGEAEQLFSACKQQNICAEKYTTLETALKTTAHQAKAGTSVLFSPGGASFDLFKSYQERGERFKELVLNLPITTKQEPEQDH